MIFKNNSLEIAQNYDHFILDVWGVIHDGTHAYDGVVDSLISLKNLGKKIYFLSNAPRRSSKVAAVLAKFGVKPDFYDFIMTSGEAVYTTLQENQNNGFKDYGQNYYYIGPGKDKDLLDGLKYNSKAAKDANFAIVTGFDDDFSKAGEKLPELLECKKYDLPLICANPDLMVIKKTGQELLCAGLIANQYQEMGGKVIYFGKPYEEVYKKTLSLAKITDKSRIIAIGDGIETDIKGANKVNIDSALIGGGVLSNILKIKYGQLPKESDLLVVCNGYQIYPKFVLAQL